MNKNSWKWKKILIQKKKKINNYLYKRKRKVKRNGGNMNKNSWNINKKWNKSNWNIKKKWKRNRSNFKNKFWNRQVVEILSKTNFHFRRTPFRVRLRILPTLPRKTLLLRHILKDMKIYTKKIVEIGVTRRKFVHFRVNLAQLSTKIRKLHSASEDLWINIYWSSGITDGTLQCEGFSFFFTKDENVLMWLERKRTLTFLH